MIEVTECGVCGIKRVMGLVHGEAQIGAQQRMQGKHQRQQPAQSRRNAHVHSRFIQIQNRQSIHTMPEV